MSTRKELVPNPKLKPIHKAFAKLEERVRKSEMTMKGSIAVAILSGPAIVIEAIVYKAIQDTKCEIDWGYCGGRAIIYTRYADDHDKVRQAIGFLIPTSDIKI